MKSTAHRSINFLSITTILLLVVLSVNAQQIAFPGAEGAGRFTSGGRGTPSSPTTVFEVTNLTDVNSVGSLRYACSNPLLSIPIVQLYFGYQVPFI